MLSLIRSFLRLCGTCLICIEQFLLRKKSFLFTEIVCVLMLMSIVLIPIDWLAGWEKLFVVGFRNIFSTFLAILMLIYLNAPRYSSHIKSFLSMKPFYTCSQLTYSAYIWHPMMVFAFYFLFWENDHILDQNEMVMTAMMSIAGTIVLSVLSFLYIEKPFMNMRKYF